MGVRHFSFSSARNFPKEQSWTRPARTSTRPHCRRSRADRASTTWSSVPASPAACWPSGWPASSDSASSSSTAAAHRRQRLRPLRRCRRADPPVRPAHLPHQLGRDLRVPVAVHASGGRTSTACWPASTGSCCRCRSTSTPSTACTASTLDRVRDGRVARLGGRDARSTIRTSEDVVVSKVGRELYDKFFRGYTRKQWGLDPSELDASVTARVPTRTNRDDRYFTDTFQAMPAHGYTRMFERMLRPSEHQGDAEHRLSRGRRGAFRGSAMIYTGPIDEFFDYRYGRCRIARSSSITSTCPGALPGRRRRSTTRTTTPTRASPSSSTSPGSAIRRRRSSTSTRAPRAIRTTRCRGPRTRRCTSATRPWPSDDRRHVRRPAGDLSVLQHGSGGGPGAGGVQAHRQGP